MKQFFLRCILSIVVGSSSLVYAYELEHNPHNPFLTCGNHVIAEFMGCSNTNNYEQLATILTSAAEAAGATVLSVKTHKFEPQGMTGVAVLSESHISVHTWPEYGYIALDVFTCGIHVDVIKAVEVLKNFFNPMQSNIKILNRGLEKENIQPDLP